MVGKTMTGMNRHTGFASTERDHIAQSIGDILSTPLGSRVMRRDYGSLLTELIDSPQTPTTRQLMLASTVKAISQWEPRINVRRTNIIFSSTGAVSIDVSAAYANDSQNRNPNIRFTIPIQSNGRNSAATGE